MAVVFDSVPRDLSTLGNTPDGVLQCVSSEKSFQSPRLRRGSCYKGVNNFSFYDWPQFVKVSCVAKVLIGYFLRKRIYMSLSWAVPWETKEHNTYSAWWGVNGLPSMEILWFFIQKANQKKRLWLDLPSTSNGDKPRLFPPISRNSVGLIFTTQLLKNATKPPFFPL